MNSIKLLEYCKRIFAIGIFVCLFLPLCQCTQKADIAENPASQTAETAKDNDQHVVIMSRELEFRSPAESLAALPVFVAFGWPGLACLIRPRLRRRAYIVALNLSELLCCAAGLWCFAQLLRLWPEWRYGGIILCSSYLAHMLTSGLDIAAQARQVPHPAPH